MQLIAASADKADAAKTAKIAGSVTMQIGGKQQQVPIDGAVDVTRQAMSLTVDTGALGLPSAGKGSFEMRVVDGVVYVHLGDLGGKLPGVKWLKVDVGSVPGASGALGQADPSATLDALRGAGEVKAVGEESVRGVSTTHYRVTIDLKRALDRVPADLKAQASAGLERMGTTTLPADVWIDGDGQARKISMSFDTPAGGVSETIEYYDYGAPVDVTAPPANEVGDFSSLFAGLGRAA